MAILDVGWVRDSACNNQVISVNQLDSAKFHFRSLMLKNVILPNYNLFSFLHIKVPIFVEQLSLADSEYRC